MQRLQRVQNCAARILTRTKKYDHITPVLQRLHWLPVHLRVRVYTVFSFFVFKFANEKRITNSFFVFRFQICERKTINEFLFFTCTGVPAMSLRSAQQLVFCFGRQHLFTPRSADPGNIIGQQNRVNKHTER